VGKWGQMRPMPELLVAAPDAGKFTTWLDGRTLCTSAKPFLDARVLLAVIRYGRFGGVFRCLALLYVVRPCEIRCARCRAVPPTAAPASPTRRRRSLEHGVAVLVGVLRTGLPDSESSAKLWGVPQLFKNQSQMLDRGRESRRAPAVSTGGWSCLGETRYGRLG
jgi:hypothetical protein